MAIRIRYRKFIELDTEAELDVSLGDAETLFYTNDTSKYWRILSSAFEEVPENQIFQKLPIEVSDINISGTPTGDKFLRDDGAWAEGLGGVTGSGTINELAYWASGTALGALAVATYPSLTEVSYVKGVTSAIQTQLNSKWSLATGGTLTGVNTITSNTPNQLIFNGTWTATAGNQYHINFAGSFTGRAAQTTEDYSIYNFNPTLIAGAPSNDFGVAVAIQPTWTGTWSNPIALYVSTSGTSAKGLYIINTTGTTNFGYQVIGAGGGISFAADYRGMMTIGNSNFTQGIHGGTGTYSSINDSNIFLTFAVNPATTGTIYRYYLRNSTNGNWVPTAGSTSILRVETTNTAGSRDYAPTSGSHALTVLDLNGLRVNTSGTYTGSIIGIDWNPTLTSTTGLTHIALRATSGSVLIGHTTLGASTTRLQVRGIGSAANINSLWEDSTGAETMKLHDSGGLIITKRVQTSAWVNTFKTTSAAHTGLTAATEFVDSDHVGATWTWADGTVTTQRFNYFRGYTLNKTTTSATFTDAYNLYVDDLTAGSGVTITNKWSLGLAGNLKVSGARVNMANLPTSSAGLATGDLWNDSGTIKVA